MDARTTMWMRDERYYSQSIFLRCSSSITIHINQPLLRTPKKSMHYNICSVVHDVPPGHQNDWLTRFKPWNQSRAYKTCTFRWSTCSLRQDHRISRKACNRHERSSRPCRRNMAIIGESAAYSEYGCTAFGRVWRTFGLSAWGAGASVATGGAKLFSVGDSLSASIVVSGCILGPCAWRILSGRWRGPGSCLMGAYRDLPFDELKGQTIATENLCWRAISEKGKSRVGERENKCCAIDSEVKAH